MTFLSWMTHAYINLPTTWGYYTKFYSSPQPSGDIPIVYTWQKYNYIILPMQSGDTNYIICPIGLIQIYEKTYHTLDLFHDISKKNV